MNKYAKILLIFIFSLSLTACATLTHEAAQTVVSQLQAEAKNPNYPAAKSHSALLISSPPGVDLSQYQSVENRPHQRPDIAIAIAASGGGYRAANLTAGVLMGLEQITDPNLQGNLLEEVDYFSTVSGGGFGVGYYIASLKDFIQTHGQNSPFAAQFSFVNTMHNVPDNNPLDTDYTGELFFADDRGQQIEQSFADNILRTKTGTLKLNDIFIPRSHNPSEVQLPYWVTNSTIYQNAALFPFTPDVLQKYGINRYEYNHKFYAVRDVGSMPVAIGMASSSSFPFALTPTTLGSNQCGFTQNCYLQLLDGGLSDNLGVYTALDLLRQDPAKTKILIVIDAYAGEDQPFSKEAAPPAGTTLFWRIMGIGTDASRQLVKRNINTMARDELCLNKTKNVLVIYLDLENYTRAREISTGLFITRKQQKLLLNIGQSLVANNPQFNQLLKPLLDGNTHIGQCPI